MELKLTNDIREFLKCGNTIRVNNEYWYNIPHWFKEDGDGLFSLVEEDNLPFYVKEHLLAVNKRISKMKDSEIRKDVELWIDQWLELFPKGIKSGGKPIKSNAKDCIPKMIQFIKKYKYDSYIIALATEQYLEERKENDWKYCKCATYFIDKKEQGSTLAEWCELVLSDKKEKKPTNTNFFV